MGFFTDAYDLLNIGYILAIITDAYKYAGITIPGFTEYLVGSNAAFWTGLLASISLWSAIIGQLFFGFLGDYWGREKGIRCRSYYPKHRCLTECTFA